MCSKNEPAAIGMHTVSKILMNLNLTTGVPHAPSAPGKILESTPGVGNASGSNSNNKIAARHESKSQLADGNGNTNSLDEANHGVLVKIAADSGPKPAKR